jgi:RNA polymerase sigma factor (sigma-70 family)
MQRRGRRRRRPVESALGRSSTDPLAFGQFYSEHASGLLSYFLRRTFDVEVSRDLMAETFAQAFQHRARFRGTTDGEAAGWLYGIARHQLSRYTRRGVVERRALDKLAIEVPEVTLEDHQRLVAGAGLVELQAELATAVARLPPAQREALELRVVEELSYVEVARRLSVSEPTARARVSRALRSLASSTEPPVRKASA